MTKSKRKKKTHSEIENSKRNTENYKGSECLPCLQTDVLACHNIMDVD